MSLYAITQQTIILYTYIATLFFIEIYYLAKKKYVDVILQSIMMIPLIGILSINGIPFSNLYISILTIYLLLFSKKVNINKNVFFVYILVVLSDILKFIIFNYNISNIIDILSMPVLYLSMLAGILIYKIGQNENKVEEFSYSFVKGTLLSVVYGIITRFLKGGFIYAFVNTNIITRNSGGSGDPNYYGLYICISVAILIVFKIIKDKKNLPLLAVFLMFTGLSSSSRMYYAIMFFLLFIIAVILIKRLMSKYFIKTLLVIGLLLIISFVFKNYIISNFNYLRERLEEVDITNGRSDLIVEYTEKISSNILSAILGVGIPKYNIRCNIGHYAHNLYVELYVTQGMIGSMFIAILFILYAFKNVRQNNIIYLIPFLTFCIGGFGVNYIEVDSFYLLLAILILIFSTLSKNVQEFQSEKVTKDVPI